MGIAVNPWQLTATAQTFIAVLNGCVDLSFFFFLSFFVLADKHTDFKSFTHTDVVIQLQIWHLLRSMLWNPHCRFLDCEKKICQKWVVFPLPVSPQDLFVWYGDLQLLSNLVDDLYRGNEQSVYWYWHGFNWRAFLAFSLAITPAMPGYISESLSLSLSG